MHGMIPGYKEYTPKERNVVSDVRRVNMVNATVG